jgi:pimeloyl-ACP methyl ester carboxylesterase
MTSTTTAPASAPAAAPTQASTPDMKVPFTAAWLKGPRQTSFYTRSYLPDTGTPRAALVFAHGFVEHVGRYEHVFPAYAKKGIAVFAFDMRGFGRTALDNERSAGSSYGKTNSADQRADLRWALSEAEKQWAGVPLFLMGHSMVGAYCSTHYGLTQASRAGWCSRLVVHDCRETDQPHWCHRNFTSNSSGYSCLMGCPQGRQITCYGSTEHTSPRSRRQRGLYILSRQLLRDTS